MNPWTRGIVCAVLGAAAFSRASDSAPAPDAPETPEARAERMRWFNEARFGMFIH